VAVKAPALISAEYIQTRAVQAAWRQLTDQPAALLARQRLIHDRNRMFIC